MWKLLIETASDKHDAKWTETFNDIDLAAKRRAFLKSIEKFGSTNTYRIISA